jgi:hypothetical protein
MAWWRLSRAVRTTIRVAVRPVTAAVETALDPIATPVLAVLDAVAEVHRICGQRQQCKQ